MDFDPEARERTFKVKIIAPEQPVPPDALPGTPVRPVVLEGLTVTPYIKEGKFPKIAYSLRATGLAAPKRADVLEGGLTCWSPRPPELRSLGEGRLRRKRPVVDLLARTFGGQFAQTGLPVGEGVRHGPARRGSTSTTLLDYAGRLLRPVNGVSSHGRRRPSRRPSDDPGSRRTCSAALTGIRGLALVLAALWRTRVASHRAGRPGPPGRPALVYASASRPGGVADGPDAGGLPDVRLSPPR